MTMNKGLYTSDSSEYETPDELFQHYNRRFNFTCDVCANENNFKVKHYFDKKDDGLKQKWNYINWMNPPYGKDIKKWVKKAYEEGKKGNLVVCLLPARTDTRWWHDYVTKADHIHFIKGRLKFNKVNGAPFPSVVVIFGLNY